MSLLQETRDAIMESGHTPEDIVFIGSVKSGHCCTWPEFLMLADIDYTRCSCTVALDLKIVFKDGLSMWREVFDKREWWSFAKPHKLPIKRQPIKTLIAPYAGATLAICNSLVRKPL